MKGLTASAQAGFVLWYALKNIAQLYAEKTCKNGEAGKWKWRECTFE